MASFSARQALYRQLCEVIWNPATFGIDVPGDVERAAAQERQRYYGVGVQDLLEAGLLRPDQQLVGERAGMRYSATVTAEGYIELEDGRRERSPSNGRRRCPRCSVVQRVDVLADGHFTLTRAEAPREQR